MLNACAIRFIASGAKFPDWRQFSEWLGGYEYIMPGNRTILSELAIAIITKYDYEYFYKLQSWLMTNCSKETQKGLLKWILDSNS